MKSKLIKRVFSTALSLVLGVGLLGTSALAAETVNDVKEKTGTNGNIVVTVYDQEPGQIGTGAQIGSGLSNPVDGVGVNALRIGSVVELTTTDDNNSVSTQVAFGLSSDICTLLGLNTGDAIANQEDGGTTTYYFKPNAVQRALESATQTDIENYLNKNGATNKVTGADGVANFNNLDYGLYLLGKSSMPSDAITDLAPFLVSVPMYVESDAGSDWQSTVYSYPKVRTAEITSQKTANLPNGEIHVNAGDSIPFSVTTTIPATQSAAGAANKFSNFSITDTNPGSTLKIDTNSVKVKLGDTVLTKDTHYTVSYTGGVLTVTLTDTATTGGLEELNKGLNAQQILTVSYNASAVTDVAFSTKLTNNAKVTYQRTGMTAAAEVEGNTVDLYTYGINLTKTLSDGSAVAENAISFELYKTNNGGTLSDKIAVKAGNGGYWVAANGETGVVPYVGVDGKLTIYGLKPGTYYLKETATMEGYTLLGEPITIVIDDADKDGIATATVNGANAQVVNGVMSLSVENTKNEAGFTLPQTGGAGTLMVTAIGLALLCVGVILLVVYRKKGENNT